MHSRRLSLSSLLIRRSSFFFLFLFVLLPLSARAQYPWSGILDPSRATDWSKAGVQGGIPTYTTICSTVNPSGDATGTTDSTNINHALSTCASTASASSPQVVLLASGTFYSNVGIGAPLGTSYLVLRGAGPDKTIIKFVGTSSQCGWGSGVDVCLGGNPNINYIGNGGETGWLGTNGSIGTYTQGASVLDLSSTSNLSVGQPIVLTQRDDSIGLCPQSGGVGNCSGKVGLSAGGTTATAVTSAPYSAITAGTEVYVGTNTNHSMDGSCGGYQSGPTPWTVLSATTTSTNTTFTYTDSNALSAPTSNCQPMYVSVDNGGLFTSDINGGTVLAQAFAGTVCPDSTAGNQCAPGEYSIRSEVETHIVRAICTGPGTPIAACKAPNEVVLDDQVIAPNYRSSQNPGVWWTGAHGIAKWSQYDGVESLTLDATNDGSAHATIDLMNTENSWVKNVRGLRAASVHVSLEVSAHDEVVDSYFWGTKKEGVESYGIDLTAAVTNALIQNNITQHVVSGIINEDGYGNVIAYNYVVELGNKTGDMLAMTDLNHGYAGANLMEGNDTNECDSDGVHGTSWALTYFRNRCRGQDTPNLIDILFSVTDPAFQRAQNWIGNTLGTVGVQKTYVQDGPIPPFPDRSVFWLNSSAGYVENGSSGYVSLSDTAVTSTLLRWGNYDVVTGAVRWCGDSSDPGWTTVCNNLSEVPTTGADFINGNPVPSSTTLPASFYLSAQPAFWKTPWGTPPWPAIGPDLTCSSGSGQDCDTPSDGVTGYSYPNPAQLCYMNTTIDPAYQQTFTVIGASWSSGTATLLIGPNTLTIGSAVTITGLNPPGYNGTQKITDETSTTISYSVPSNPGIYVSAGTATSPNIRLFNGAACYPNDFGSSPAPAPPTGLSATVK